LLEKAKANLCLTQIIDNIDVIVDGRFCQDKLSADAKKPDDFKYRGSTNQHLVDVKKSLKAKKLVDLVL
jgi:anaerobic ribonucleoside-triphosphate reductase activating protein